MRRLALAALFATLANGALAEDSSTPESTIRSQIDAFQADDFAGAFQFASPGIQGMFGSPGNFEMMVKRGYPMVWRPADVTFGAAEQRGAAVLQTVIITDQSGTVHALEYQMIPGDSGWRINGVRFIEAPQVGV